MNGSGNAQEFKADISQNRRRYLLWLQKQQKKLLGLRQAVQLFKGLVQSEIRHHIAKFLPGRLVPELSEIRQHLGRGGDEVKLRVVHPQVVQQQLRMEDDAILHFCASRYWSMAVWMRLRAASGVICLSWAAAMV